MLKIDKNDAKSENLSYHIVPGHFSGKKENANVSNYFGTSIKIDGDGKR